LTNHFSRSLFII